MPLQNKMKSFVVLSVCVHTAERTPALVAQFSATRKTRCKNTATLKLPETTQKEPSTMAPRKRSNDPSQSCNAPFASRRAANAHTSYLSPSDSTKFVHAELCCTTCCCAACLKKGDQEREGFAHHVGTNAARDPNQAHGAIQQSEQAAPPKRGACRLPQASSQINVILPLLNPPLAANRDWDVYDIGLEPVSVFL